MKRLLPITILAACTLVVTLASKPRVKKAANKTYVTHKQIVFNLALIELKHI